MADGMLGKIIDDYISTELDAARREGRQPTVLRFPESTFDELGAFGVQDDITAIASNAQQPTGQMARTQIVIAPDTEGRVVKLFFLHELQIYGLLERCLGTNTNQKLMSTGQVCRAARWTSSDGHVFNGRTSGRGESHAREQSDLQLPHFAILHDRRAGIEPEEELPRRGFEFVAGQEDTTVKQWLAGTGETQATSEGKADIPRDAEQFLAASRAHTLGRARVPQGRSVLPADDSEDDTDSSTDSSGEPEDSFAALLPGAHLTPRVARPGLRVTTSNGGTADRQTSSEGALHGGQSREVSTEGPSSELQVPEDSLMPSSARGSLGQQQRPYHEWRNAQGRKYDAVDESGLHGHTANTAEWENENRVPIGSKKGKSKGNRVVPRTTGSSVRPSASGSQFGSQADVSTSSTMAPTWSNAQIAPRPNNNRPLVNYYKFDQGSSSAKVPPGMRSAPRASEEPHTQAQQDPQNGQRLVQLVDLSYDDVHLPRATSNVRPVVGTPLVPHSAEQSALYATTSQEDESIVESILPPPPKDSHKKHNTMRQKAGNRLKSRDKVAGNKFNVQLELPDPPPAPKTKRPQQNNGEHGQDRPILGTRNNENVDNSPSAQVPHLKPSTKITTENHPFGEVLRSERRKQQDEDDEADSGSRPKLVGRIGVLLLRSGENNEALGLSPGGPIDLQTELRETSLRTDFLSRVTTSMDDAAFLIDAAWLGRSAAVTRTTHSILEILIRETGAGQLLKVVVPVGQGGLDRSKYNMKTREGVMAEASLHFPVHVYDAQISLVQPAAESEMSSKSAIDGFIESMNTDGAPPSFRAKVPPGLFNVEKVFAKRVVEAVSVRDPGIVFKLTEVQDLIPETLDMQHYNTRFLARSREEMIEDQRYWWEVSYETVDLSRAEELQHYVCGMVQQMDDVGRYNRGPFVVSEDYHSDDGTEVQWLQPFW